MSALGGFTEAFHVIVVVLEPGNTQSLKAGPQGTYLLSNRKTCEINSLVIMIIEVCV